MCGFFNHQTLRIKWHDRVPDTVVIERAQTTSVEANITASQLSWAGHIERMPDYRFPKLVFYGDLAHGKRNQDEQKLLYKEVLKRHMKTAQIDPDTWEQHALLKKDWRAAVYKSKEAVEDKRLRDYQRAHDRRHNHQCHASGTTDICGR